jgi:hypothetical protein
MADFDRIRQQLKESRDERDRSTTSIAALQQALKRNGARQADLGRVFDGERGQQVEAREQLEDERRRLEEELARQRKIRGSAIKLEAGAVRDFAAFSDPRDGIARLDDSTPILLMPVRLETRFKAVPVAGNQAPAQQLWVRIFPDDCWVDSFDPVLTENEVTHARTYWTSIWAAGGIEAQERAAWAALATGHGSGRAAWIVQQYQPVNIAEKPAKPRPQDVILTIGSETPVSPAEAAATRTFWRALWLADGDAAKIGVAMTTLELAVGEVRAGEIATTSVPANFSAPLAAGTTKDDVNLTVAFVLFPVVATRQAAWSQAPKATILPDRFVFIGYERAGDPNPLVAVGSPVPSPVLTGPDPAAAEADQLRHDADGKLIVPDELTWLTDFDRAVAAGMGMRIPLTAAQASGGFKRVLVVGLRLNADEQTGKTELETLLRHHANSRTGLAIVTQGTPTNNTEAVSSGAGRLDDPDESFEDLKAPLFTAESSWLDKRDGQWLAELLGIDPTVLAHTHHAGATDQRTARAMNTALWPATLGYWMESMMAPVFSPDAVQNTRDFFTRHVVAGGIAPAIRIGSQPYGILPATTLSRMPWLNQGFQHSDALREYLRQLHPLLEAIDSDFRTMASDVSFVGKSGDPHATLLDIVGLHPGSVEWSQRYAESFETLSNRLNLLGFGAFGVLASIRRDAAKEKLKGLGYAGAKDPPIVDLVFNGAHNRLKGGVIDDVPLSETDLIRASTIDGRNYIQWLIDASGASLDALYAQEGFTNDKEPSALLYLFLRHALQLGYHDVSVRLHEDAGLYDDTAVRRARRDDPFLHVRNNQLVSESRYQPLYTAAPQITGGTMAVHEFIASQITTLGLAWPLRDQRNALERLKGEPTARLERAFADHVDTCAYRLDAWLLGIVNYQLGVMRNVHDGSAAPPRQGIYLGGYAWLEDLVPENKQLTPVTLTDPTLMKEFGDPADSPLMRDSTNQGYVHAPSLNHAVAAAVLRNGFISNASRANRQTMAVNLTSERVRVALSMIEGIRAGQSLSDLLGYQFERGLHDRHTLAEVDKFIYKLRRDFPIRADRLNSTRPPPDASIDSIEARNVLNGLALVQHIKATNNAVYPFGKKDFPKATVDEARALKAEVDRLLESHDAVADLALSEGVYQAVLGNYDRVASTYDAYARGYFPPEPDVIRTPLNGIGLTHRVALHLVSGVDPTVSPVPGLPVVPMTPRAQGEPALNQWLAAMLPPLDQIGCMVSFREAATRAVKKREVTLRDLALQPADLLALVGDDNRQAMTELDDRIVSHAFINFGARPDVAPTITYLDKDAAAFSVFETLPLIRNLRTLTTQSRPLRPTDLTLMNEAESKHDRQPFVDRARLDLVAAAMVALRADLVAFEAPIDALLTDPIANRASLLAAVDSYVTAISVLLARAATFGMAQAGWGFAYDFRRRTYAAILDQCAARVSRWDGKLVEFAARIADVGAAVTDEARFELCAQAERTISTRITTPLPATPALFLQSLTLVKRPAFTARRGALEGVSHSSRTTLAQLLGDVQTLLPITDFDIEPFTLTAHEDEMIRFAEDVARVAAVVATELTRRLAAAATQFTASDDTAIAADRTAALERAARALLGEDFRIIPEFALTAAQGDELNNALNAARSGAPFDFLTHPPDPVRDPLDFPIDTWLYGVARVREKMRAWEQTVMFSGALGQPEPELDALQLPFAAGDHWLGLEFPPDQKLDTDRLLYTAHFSAAFNQGGAQCGLLLDEWTEMIPTSAVDTGITFHHDRPNCEAPQTMLLVTPSDFRGAWQWQDLLGALNETLDLAKRRAIEPKHIDKSAYGPFLPATAIASQVMQLTIAIELGLNNKVAVKT